jgi:hypothetical protein
MMPFVAAGFVFGSPSDPPVGWRGVKTQKFTGGTPARPKPHLKTSFDCLAFAEQKLVRNAG